MGFAKVNGSDIQHARIELSRFGAWTADLIVDAATAAGISAGQKATITYGQSLSFSGTVFRSDAFANQAALRMVGGTNKLGTLCKPRFYRGAAMQIPFGDILGDAGETISATSDAAALSVVLPFWTMIQQPVGLGLTMLSRAGPSGCVWRVLADGSVFFGVDGFIPCPDFDYELLDYSTEQGYQILAAEAPRIDPGQSFAGHNVSLVEHILDPDKSRVKIWFEQ